MATTSAIISPAGSILDHFTANAEDTETSILTKIKNVIAAPFIALGSLFSRIGEALANGVSWIAEKIFSKEDSTTTTIAPDPSRLSGPQHALLAASTVTTAGSHLTTPSTPARQPLNRSLSSSRPMSSNRKKAILAGVAAIALTSTVLLFPEKSKEALNVILDQGQNLANGAINLVTNAFSLLPNLPDMSTVTNALSSIPSGLYNAGASLASGLGSGASYAFSLIPSLPDITPVIDAVSSIPSGLYNAGASLSSGVVALGSDLANKAANLPGMHIVTSALSSATSELHTKGSSLYNGAAALASDLADGAALAFSLTPSLPSLPSITTFTNAISSIPSGLHTAGSSLCIGAAGLASGLANGAAYVFPSSSLPSMTIVTDAISDVHSGLCDALPDLHSILVKIDIFDLYARRR
jgi:hypothetical protein